MKFCVLQARLGDDRAKWKWAWDLLPSERRDVYFLPEYLLASEAEGLGTGYCALAIENEAVWLYPFLKCAIHPIDKTTEEFDLYDLQSAYGYGGPVVNKEGEDEIFIREAWRCLYAWCKEERVVGEFCRFHPLINNHHWAPPEMCVIEDRKTVAIDLNTYPNKIWNDSYFRVQRNMIRRAEREGYEYHTLPSSKQMSWFALMYARTQDVIQAGTETRFGEAYFESLVQGLGEKSWLGIVKKGTDIAAAVLVLEGAQIAYSHLMAYGSGGATAGMTNILYHGVALEAAERGLKILYMGGGKTKDDKDPLLYFKKSLGQGRRMFYIGTRCHDSELYDLLGTRWEKQHGPRPAGYFLFYRL